MMMIKKHHHHDHEWLGEEIMVTIINFKDSSFIEKNSLAIKIFIGMKKMKHKKSELQQKYVLLSRI
jgi:hypothetical protein